MGGDTHLLIMIICVIVFIPRHVVWIIISTVSKIIGLQMDHREAEWRVHVCSEFLESLDKGWYFHFITHTAAVI